MGAEYGGASVEEAGEVEVEGVGIGMGCNSIVWLENLVDLRMIL